MFYKDKLSLKNKKLYDLILDGLLNHDPEIQLNTVVPNIFDIVDCVKYDNPQLFDVESITSQTGSKTTLYPDYEYTKEEYFAIRTKCILASKNIVKTVQGDPYTKELLIHDWICKNLKYVKDSPGAHSIVGPLLYRTGVCEGFSKLFKLLMDMVECPTIFISGYHIQNNNKDPHSWNAVLINNKWYNVDATFDNTLSETTVRYDYFNIPDRILDNDHEPNSYKVFANSMEFNYYARNRLIFSSVPEIYQYLSNLYSSKEIHFSFMYVNPDPDSQTNEILNILSRIISVHNHSRKYGISNNTSTYTYSGFITQCNSETFLGTVFRTWRR